MSGHRFRAKPTAFLCECGASLCDERVSMSGAEYDAGVGPVLAHGHGPGPELGTRPRKTPPTRAAKAAVAAAAGGGTGGS